MIESIESKEKIEKEIIRTWLTGRTSCTLVIPKDFAREYQLDKPSHVVVEGRPDGILIRKLEV
jgi:hypothetical protein